MAKRKLVTLDLEKEFEWIPTEEIDEEKPTKFFYKALSNRDSADYNSKLVKYTNNFLESTIDEQKVNYQIVFDKVFKIENIYLDNTIRNITKKEDIELFILKTMPSTWIIDLASEIRAYSEISKEDLEALKKP